MATTLAQLETMVARDLRDTGNNTWNTNELDDLINQGIDAVSEVYPKQVYDTSLTILANTWTYAIPSSFNRDGIYRVDIFTSAASYRYTLGSAQGDGPNSGWETHAGVLFLPVSVSFVSTDLIRLFGYGRFAQLSSSSDTTDMDSTAIWGMRVFARSEAYDKLLQDRAKFQQWQAQTNNTDVTAAVLNGIAFSARRRWKEERDRLRRVRKKA